MALESFYEGCIVIGVTSKKFVANFTYFSAKPQASTSHCSSMRFACMEVSTVQVFLSCFQLANSGLRTSEKISTYPALELIAQQFKFSCRCHSFKPTKKHTTHKTRKLTSTCFFYGKMASSKPLRTCLANTSLKPLLKLPPAAQLCAQVHSSIAACKLSFRPMPCQLVKLSNPSQHHKRRIALRGLAFLASAQTISKIQYFCTYVKKL